MKKSSGVLAALLAIFFVYFGSRIGVIFLAAAPIPITTFNLVMTAFEMLLAAFGIYFYYAIVCMAEWRPCHYTTLKKCPPASVIVPVFNEDMNIVTETLESCKKQKYPGKTEIIVADDSTDKKTAAALRYYCRNHSIKYLHRNNRRGYKAGAINNALSHCRGDIIAVINADDRPIDSFLLTAASMLATDKRIAFVQMRNAERNHEKNFITRAGKTMWDLLFIVLLKSQDDKDSAVFCGSGGVIRRSAFDDIGGFPDDSLTEDVNMSVLMLEKGYISRYADAIACEGIAPYSFSGLSLQMYRWAHGFARTAKIRMGSILRIQGFSRKTEHVIFLSLFFVGPTIVAIDILSVLSLLAKIPIFHLYRPLYIGLLGLVPALGSLAAVFVVQARERQMHLARAIEFLVLIPALSVTFSRACISAIFWKKDGEFIPTPRNSKKAGAVRMFWLEALLGSVSIAAGMTNIFDPLYSLESLRAILYGAAFLAAPILAIRYG